jgi:phytoene dehydrogenase-like protein
VIERDHARTAAHLARWSARDAERYPAFMQALGAIAGLAADLLQDVPPDIDTPRRRNSGACCAWAAASARSAGPRRCARCVGDPMAVADVLEDWFETDVLRATLATRGVFGSFLGPRSAGTMAGLLLEAARQPEAPLAPVFVAGGPGALTAALATAAKAAGRRSGAMPASSESKPPRPACRASCSRAARRSRHRQSSPTPTRSGRCSG